MATDRTAHVKRYYSPNGKCWADVMRIDRIGTNIYWNDTDNEEGRIYETVVLEPPDETVALYPDAQGIPIKRIKRIEFNNSGQRVGWTFDNSVDNTYREYRSARVYNRGGNQSLTQTGWPQYKATFEDLPPETRQYVTVEIPDRVYQQLSAQRVGLSFDNSEIREFLGGSVESEFSYRLDPFQFVINIYWGEEESGGGGEYDFARTGFISQTFGANNQVGIYIPSTLLTNYIYAPPIGDPEGAFEWRVYGLSDGGQAAGGNQGGGIHLTTSLGDPPDGYTWSLSAPEPYFVPTTYSGTTITYPVYLNPIFGSEYIVDRYISVDVVAAGVYWLTPFGPEYPLIYRTLGSFGTKLELEWRPIT
jgi:hypothetical protein